MDARTPFRIFLNYRREDSSGYAGRLYDSLSEHFGKENVFMDVDTLEPGVDFGEVIDEALRSSDVFLALIGPRWLTATDDEGRRRLDNPGDFVRMEVEAALGRDDVRLIPVLIQDAEMPPQESLPPALKELSGRNAVELRHTSWRFDVERFVAALERARDKKAGHVPEPRRWWRPGGGLALAGVLRDRRRLLALVAAAVLVALAVVLALLFVGDDDAGGSGGGEAAELFDGAIAYERDGRIKILDGLSGEEDELNGSSDGDRDPDWLRDGAALAFVRDGDIAFQDLDEPGEPTLVLIDGTVVRDLGPTWSPDGARLAWTRDDGNSTRIVVADARAGASLTDLTEVSGRQGVAPAWSPSGDLIAFQSELAVWVMGTDGSSPRRLSDRGELFPAWSPDGERLAFVTTGRACTVVVLELGSGARTLAADGEPDMPCRDPSFSPDGTEIAFSNPREGGGLWIVPADGSEAPREVLSRPGIRGLSWGRLPGE